MLRLRQIHCRRLPLSLKRDVLSQRAVARWHRVRASPQLEHGQSHSIRWAKPRDSKIVADPWRSASGLSMQLLFTKGA